MFLGESLISASTRYYLFIIDLFLCDSQIALLRILSCQSFGRGACVDVYGSEPGVLYQSELADSNCCPGLHDKMVDHTGLRCTFPSSRGLKPCARSRYI